MALEITFYTPLSMTPVATIKRKSDGATWSVAASAFQASPTFANSKITLTQGTGVYARTYTASVASLGSPGEICVYVHDDAHASDLPVAARETVVQSDNEVGRNVNVVASVSGSVASVTGAVGSVTGNVGGNVAGSVGSVSSVSNIVTAIFAHVVTGTRTFAGIMRVVASACGGKMSKPTADRCVFRDLDDTKDVIDATTNADEERETVTVDDT